MRARLMVLAALGSAALLAGAFGFQYIGDLPPCKMCLWQRWPHAVAILIGLIGALMPLRLLALAGAAAAATTAGIGAYHVGVEQGWFEGPSTCTSGAIGGQSVQDLMKSIMEAPLVRCDEIAWEWLGLSMAGWNMVISLGLMGVWLLAAASRR